MLLLFASTGTFAGEVTVSAGGVDVTGELTLSAGISQFLILHNQLVKILVLLS